MNTIANEEQFPQLAKLLKPAEIADLLGISRSFAYHLLQTGAIPVVRLGRACRVRPQDLENYILKNLGTQPEGN